MNREITLSWAEITFASNAGLMRQIVNERDGREQGQITKKYDAWGTHIWGAIGEYAIAKLLNMHWIPHLANFGIGDLGGECGVEIRHTVHSSGHLLVGNPQQEKDISRPFILVTGSLDHRNDKNEVVANCPGWDFGTNCQNPEW